MEDNKVYQLFEDMKELIGDTQNDVNKFSEKGVSAAGTRVRKNMQMIKNICQEIRKEVSEQKKAK